MNIIIDKNPSGGAPYYELGSSKDILDHPKLRSNSDKFTHCDSIVFNNSHNANLKANDGIQ